MKCSESEQDRVFLKIIPHIIIFCKIKLRKVYGLFSPINIHFIASKEV